MTRAAQLRALLAGDRIVMALGTYDAWSARLIEAAGFPAVYMTGCGVSASVLGRPDIGLISFQEMAAALRSTCACTAVPVIADADNGYGGTWSEPCRNTRPPGRRASSWRTRAQALRPHGGQAADFQGGDDGENPGRRPRPEGPGHRADFPDRRRGRHRL